MYFDPTYDSNQQPIRTKGKAMRKIYYGRISTTDGQTSASQYADAEAHGIDKSDVFIDEGVSGYHVAPMDRPQWQHVERDLRHGGVLVVRWLDRISRRYDELHSTMRRLMAAGVKVICTLNGMEFDGQEADEMKMAVRDALLAFMAAQGQADYKNRREMQKRGIEVAKKEGAYAGVGRKRAADYAEVRAWRAENGASIAQTAEQFGISAASVKRALREKGAAEQLNGEQQ
jgi:putative DNA-invertase from lambdoid prophage Rac